MSTYVHCTCGQPMLFCFNEPSTNKNSFIVSPKKDKDGNAIEIRVGGGAYVLTREGGRIRKVVITEFSDEEIALLNTHPAYLAMKKRGFITERKADHPELDAASGNPTDMEKKDNTSQILDKDHAMGLDERVSHGGTRATGGIHNDVGGDQPLAANEGSYGHILL